MNPEISSNLLKRLRSRFTQKRAALELGVNERTVRRWESGETPPKRIPAKEIYALLEPAEPRADFTFVDLFAGIGGTRLGFENTGGRCVLTVERDKYARQTYERNFISTADHQFVGDIHTITRRNPEPDHAGEVRPASVTEIRAAVPDHDVLLAGFPCQPFSIAGVSKKNSLGRAHGFLDETQGTLFFDLARIIQAKRPAAFLLENVRNLVSHDQGRTFETIQRVLRDELEYEIRWRVVSARHWVPQRRQRILIVGFDRKRTRGHSAFEFDETCPEWMPDRNSGSKLQTTLFSVSDSPHQPSEYKFPTMRDVLHPENGTEATEAPYTAGRRAIVDSRYTLSNHLWKYLQNYRDRHREAGNGFGFGLVGPDAVARTLSARYYKDGAEILVDRGPDQPPRRLTPRECARLMGFPDSFQIPVSDSQAYKQFGNSIVVPMVEAIARAMRPGILAHTQPIVENAAA